jgi:hypothetical protein
MQLSERNRVEEHFRGYSNERLAGVPDCDFEFENLDACSREIVTNSLM